MKEGAGNSGRALRCGLALLVAAVLAGCQANGPAGVLDPDGVGGGAAAPADAAAETVPVGGKVGSGSVRIAVMLPAGGSGMGAEQSRDVRDGVTMAVEDLGSDALTAVFANQPAGGSAKEGVIKAAGEGAAAVIGPFEPGAAGEIATIKGATLTPVFLLAEGVPGSTSIYSVPLQSGTSAAAGARAVAKDGARSFVLITRDGRNAAAVEKAVDLAVADHGGRINAQARFGSDPASAVKAIDTVFKVVSAPDAVVVAGSSADPVAIVRAIRGHDPKIRIVGNNSWASAGALDAALDGVLIAEIDRSELDPVAARFRSRFGHEFTPLAAYAYDVIALSTGIARAVGKEGFVRQIIEDRKGFRGSTGIFRFRGDGSSERLLALYRVEGGQLKRQEPPPKVF